MIAVHLLRRNRLNGIACNMAISEPLTTERRDKVTCRVCLVVIAVTDREAEQAPGMYQGRRGR